jgi:hypothetical protein
MDFLAVTLGYLTPNTSPSCYYLAMREVNLQAFCLHLGANTRDFAHFLAQFSGRLSREEIMFFSRRNAALIAAGERRSSHAQRAAMSVPLVLWGGSRR